MDKLLTSERKNQLYFEMFETLPIELRDAVKSRMTNKTVKEISKHICIVGVESGTEAVTIQARRYYTRASVQDANNPKMLVFIRDIIASFKKNKDRYKSKEQHSYDDIDRKINKETATENLSEHSNNGIDYLRKLETVEEVFNYLPTDLQSLSSEYTEDVNDLIASFMKEGREIPHYLCENVISLDLSKTYYLTPENLSKIIKSFKNLQSLKLPANAEDCHLKLIGENLNELKELDLSFYCKNIKEEGFANIAKLSKLEKLNLTGSNVTDQNLQDIVRANSGLKYLNLKNCTKLTETGLGSISKLADLELLNMAECSVSDDNIINIAKQLKYLTHLDLTSCKNISETGFGVLQYLSHLTELMIGDTNITQESLLRVTKRLSEIQEINLSGLNMTDDTFFGITENLPSLKVLSLSRVRGLTDAGFSYIQRFKNLSKLDISSTNIDEDCYNRFISQLPLVFLFYDGYDYPRA